MAVKKDNSNKTLLIVGGLALAGALLGFRSAYVEPGEITGEFDQGNDEDELEAALKVVVQLYGRPYAEKVEQLLRLESGHFSSQQWKQGHTAGMEATSKTFPFGWPSLEEFINAMPTLNLYPDSFSVYAMDENGTDDVEDYIKFPSAYDFVFFIAWFIDKKRGGNFGKWYSLNDNSANSYLNTLDTITPDIVNSI